MLSHRNLQANFEQLMAHYFSQFGGVAPPDTTIVSWLPFYHDMGLILGICGPILGGYRSELTSPMAFLQRPARWVQCAGHQHPGLLGGARTSPSNWPCARRPTRTWPASTSATC